MLAQDTYVSNVLAYPLVTRLFLEYLRIIGYEL